MKTEILERLLADELRPPVGPQPYGALAVIRINVPDSLSDDEARRAAEVFCSEKGLDVVSITSVARSDYRRVYDLTDGREKGKV